MKFKTYQEESRSKWWSREWHNTCTNIKSNVKSYHYQMSHFLEMICHWLHCFEAKIVNFSWTEAVPRATTLEANNSNTFQWLLRAVRERFGSATLYIPYFINPLKNAVCYESYSLFYYEYLDTSKTHVRVQIWSRIFGTWWIYLNLLLQLFNWI